MRRLPIASGILFFIIFSTSLLAGQAGRPHFGFSAGLGLPKIPLSQFRTPVSFLASGMVYMPVYARMGIQMDGNALTTVSMGTVNRAEDDFKFDLIWASASLTYRMRGLMESRAALMAGFGVYRIDRRIDRRNDRLDTSGFTLGMSQWMKPGGRGGYFEIRWHLLFKPEDNPQVLTLTYGFLL
ncbi:MAG TPA: hypothetical protein ENN17_05705 [bacterium]|nr:hypothetical protein [bacterium]